MKQSIRLLSILSFLILVSSLGYSDVTWTRKSSITGDLPVPNQGSQQTCCVVCDIDKDGIDDFVVGERTQTPSVVWYKYNGSGWDRYIIDETHLKPEAGGDFGDLDNDGEVEIVTGGFDGDLTNSSGQLRIWKWNGSELVLEENMEWQLVPNIYGVTISGLPMGNTVVNNVKVGDVDSDGFPEIVSGGWTYDDQVFNAQLRIWNWNGDKLELEESQEWISEDI